MFGAKHPCPVPGLTLILRPRHPGTPLPLPTILGGVISSLKARPAGPNRHLTEKHKSAGPRDRGQSRSLHGLGVLLSLVVPSRAGREGLVRAQLLQPAQVPLRALPPSTTEGEDLSPDRLRAAFPPESSLIGKPLRSQERTGSATVLSRPQTQPGSLINVSSRLLNFCVPQLARLRNGPSIMGLSEGLNKPMACDD